MSKNRGGLGRGLDALLGGAPDEVERANPLIAAEKTPSADAVASLRLKSIPTAISRAAASARTLSPSWPRRSNRWA